MFWKKYFEDLCNIDTQEQVVFHMCDFDRQEELECEVCVDGM